MFGVDVYLVSGVGSFAIYCLMLLLEIYPM
jgi:hypothetical protein